MEAQMSVVRATMAALAAGHFGLFCGPSLGLEEASGSIRRQFRTIFCAMTRESRYEFHVVATHTSE